MVVFAELGAELNKDESRGQGRTQFPVVVAAGAISGWEEMSSCANCSVDLS